MLIVSGIVCTDLGCYLAQIFIIVQIFFFPMHGSWAVMVVLLCGQFQRSP